MRFGFETGNKDAATANEREETRMEKAERSTERRLTQLGF